MRRLTIPICHLGVALALILVATACGQPAAPNPAPTKSAPPATQAPAAATKPAAAATQPAAPGTKPAVAPSPTPATSIQLTKIRLGLIPSVTAAPFFIAMDKGYFKEQGLDVEATNFASAAQMVAPLGAGQLDVGGGAPSAGLFNAVAREVNIKIVADKGSTPKGAGFEAVVVRKDLWDSGQVRSFTDLKGKKVALNSLAGVTAEPAFDKGMQEMGGGLRARDADLVQLGFADMPAALANKSVDAALISEPFLTRAVEENICTILSRADEIYPDHLEAVLFYSANFTKENPDAAKRFMVAYLMAARDYNDAFVKNDAAKRKETVDILIKNTTVKDPGLYDRMVMAGINPNGNVKVETLSHDQDYWLETGTQKEKVPVSTVVDLTFAQAAVQKLGPYK